MSVYQSAYSFLVSRCSATTYVQPTKTGFLLIDKKDGYIHDFYYLNGSKIMCNDREDTFVYADLT